MRFVDFKCNKCGNISEYVLSGFDDKVKCANCESEDMSRIFAPVGFRTSSSGSECSSGSSSCSSGGCSGGSCSSCSGCH
jgi:putative FmdB family regulatory protein